MDDAGSGHPDEGTIHAWLDGALDDARADALEAHVATCRECAERVAEARGLIAGASRIVGALDGGAAATAAIAATSTPAPMAPRTGARRWLRVTPVRAAIAATVLVAAGLSLTYERGAKYTDLRDDSPIRPTSEAAATASTPALPRDTLLEEAVKRNVAAAQPPRAVAPAPGPAIPTPEPRAPGAVLGDVAASQRVAVGRAAVQAQRESTSGTTPDQLASGAGAATDRTGGRALAAARKADSVVTLPAAPMVAAAPTANVPAARTPGVLQQPAGECYRIESANGTAATWGSIALPFVVTIEGGLARVLTVAGQETDARATVSVAGDDSLLFRLRRVGFEGTLALGAPGDARAGVMRSRPANLSPQLVAAPPTAADSMSAAAASRSRLSRRAAPRADARKEAAALAAPRADSAVAAEAATGVNAAPAVPVVARRLACPR